MNAKAVIIAIGVSPEIYLAKENLTEKKKNFLRKEIKKMIFKTRLRIAILSFKKLINYL